MKAANNGVEYLHSHFSHMELVCHETWINSPIHFVIKIVTLPRMLSNKQLGSTKFAGKWIGREVSIP